MDGGFAVVPVRVVLTLLFVFIRMPEGYRSFGYMLKDSIMLDMISRINQLLS